MFTNVLKKCRLLHENSINSVHISMHLCYLTKLKADFFYKTLGRKRDADCRIENPLSINIQIRFGASEDRLSLMQKGWCLNSIRDTPH